MIAGAISFVMTLLAVALNTFKERLSGFIHVAYTPPKFGFHLGYFLPLLLVATLTGIYSYWKYLWFLESNQLQRKKHRVKGFGLFFPIFCFFPSFSFGWSYLFPLSSTFI